MDLVKGDEINLDELLQAQAHIWHHTFRFISSMSLKCAVELQIPDIIHNHGHPITISDLGSALKIHPSKHHRLDRLMRVLVHSGFFTESQQAYSLTPASRLLRKDNPLTAAPFVLSLLGPVLQKPWHHLTSWFQNDDHSTVFAEAHGETCWEYAAHEPWFSKSLTDAMANDGLLAASAVVSKCKGVFEGLKTVVDVGGNTGTITKQLAKAFPQMEFTVFDVPHVVDGLQGTENVKFHGGNMFDEVPHGDIIMLKWVLCDWSDQDCIKILQRCREAIDNKENGGKVIIIDMIMGNHQDSDEETKLFWDMACMALVDGKERNEQQWSKLFDDSGFSRYKIYNILGLRSLIEVFP